jgi:hypothetical protein
LLHDRRETIQVPENRQPVDLLVVLPVGPDNNGADTIESIFSYASSTSVTILAIDDSRKVETRQFLDTCDERVIVLPSAGYKGIRGALFCSLGQAYKWASEHFDFETLLRIDTDALLIASGSDQDALRIFESCPDVGILGSYRTDCNGNSRDFSVVRRCMQKEYGNRGVLNHQRRRALRAWIVDAKKSGYEIGEHVLGAAAFYNPRFVSAMCGRGYMDNLHIFKDSEISEDHLFSLLSFKCGFKLADYATGGLPMGVRWRGLPDSPENLIKRNKKIIHSVKFWEDMPENEIRSFFAARRNTGRR